QIWDHLQRRRLSSEVGRDLWDQTAAVFPAGSPQSDLPSWYFTERVVECLVSAAGVVLQPPPRTVLLAGHAADLLNAAADLYDRQLLTRMSEAGESLRNTLTRVRLSLDRARSIQHERPATAVALATEVLRELDELSAARQDTVGP